MPTRVAALMVSKNLDALAGLKHISAVFLMDQDGLCVYSSRPEFVGNNYGFRPYFKDAISTGNGLYWAVMDVEDMIVFYAVTSQCLHFLSQLAFLGEKRRNSHWGSTLHNPCS